MVVQSGLPPGTSEVGQLDGIGLRQSVLGHVIVLTVQGEVDMRTAPRLADAINEALEGRPKALIVDLSAVDFLASAGLHAVLRGREVAAESIRFAVVASSRTVNRLIGIFDVDYRLTVYPTLADAVRNLG